MRGESNENLQKFWGIFAEQANRKTNNIKRDG